MSSTVKKPQLIVNLRSDTFTKPCQAMRQAIFEAEVGDDVCGEDPTVNRLEIFAASLVEKEAALFVSSGTMGNLIAIMVHCNTRGCELYVGEDSHIVLHEQGSAAQLAGVMICPLPNNPDGTFDLKKLKQKLRDPNDIHHPRSKMIAVENTMNGKVLPMAWLQEVGALAREQKLKLHMDGARLWNAVAAGCASAKDIVKNCDSVTFCLSKGLGAPAGSLLCGTTAFIHEARRCRKALGGGMRQVGILAAAGFVALGKRMRLTEDHAKAREIMAAISSTGSKIITVDPQSVQTNMVFVQVAQNSVTDAVKVVERLGVVEDDHEDDQTVIQAWADWPGSLRLVLHLDISQEMLLAAMKKIIYVIKKLDPALGHHAESSQA